MKKLSLTILTILISLVSFSQEYKTCDKLDSLIWEKINVYRTTDHAIVGIDYRPSVITKFGLGDMREYCYEVTMRNTKGTMQEMKHSTYDELTPTANGECLYRQERSSPSDFTDIDYLNELADRVVTCWINSWTHRTVIGWLDREVSTVTSIHHTDSNGRTVISVTYHAK